jgi:hypothetical protein
VVFFVFDRRLGDVRGGGDRKVLGLRSGPARHGSHSRIAGGKHEPVLLWR